MDITTASQLESRIADLLTQAGKRPGRRLTARFAVEPVLRGLGWNLDNLAEARFDVPLAGTEDFTDYALYVDGKAAVAVRVSGLGEGIGDLAAAMAPGFDWTLVTDGCEWATLSAFRPGSAFRALSVGAEEGNLDVLLLVSRQMVASGEALDLAEEVATDGAVADALLEFLRDKTRMRAEIHSRLPNIPLRKIQAAMKRIEVSVNGIGVNQRRTSGQSSAAAGERDAVRARIEAALGVELERVGGSHSTFATSDGGFAVQISSSKVHSRKGPGGGYYWYGIRPLIFDLAETHSEAVVCLARADGDELYMVPAGRLRAIVGLLATTERDGETSHYHAFVHADEDGKAMLHRNETPNEPLLALDEFAWGMGK